MEFIMEAKIQVKRYNIYSCLTLKINDQELCFDPAKIQREQIDEINPDFIFVSHESMDHMDPIQLYKLQKKKNCKVFCSIAVAVDLMQYYFCDTEFIDKVQVLIPGSSMTADHLFIETVKSIHCDYMMPLVFKISFLNNDFSLIHCFDSHLSDEIIKLSENTNLGIIPIGIAKGVSPASGKEFADKLKSQIFLTNHFKNDEQLNDFNELIKKEGKCSKYLLLRWNESCEVKMHLCEKGNSLSKIQRQEKISENTLCNEILKSETISLDQLHAFLIKLNEQRCKLLQNKEVLKKLYTAYPTFTEEKKKVLLIILIMISLIDPYLIEEKFIIDLKKDLLSNTINENNNVQAVSLCFMGVYAQQIAKNYCLNEVSLILDRGLEHVDYWIVEFLGRSAISKGADYLKALEILKEKVIDNKKLYNSVVIRRKIFWELYRIMKHIPHVANRFFTVFEDGLVDSNPDVRLLAILCFGLANRIADLSKEKINNIFKLFKDEEDDVREIALTVVGMFIKHYEDEILNKKERIESMLRDHNCHVQGAAKEILRLLLKKPLLIK